MYSCKIERNETQKRSRQRKKKKTKVSIFSARVVAIIILIAYIQRRFVNRPRRGRIERCSAISAFAREKEKFSWQHWLCEIRSHRRYDGTGTALEWRAFARCEQPLGVCMGPRTGRDFRGFKKALTVTLSRARTAPRIIYGVVCQNTAAESRCE